MDGGRKNRRRGKGKKPEGAIKWKENCARVVSFIFPFALVLPFFLSLLVVLRRSPSCMVGRFLFKRLSKHKNKTNIMLLVLHSGKKITIMKKKEYQNGGREYLKRSSKTYHSS